MASTRSEVMAAIELASIVLTAADTAANYREPFVELLGLDPGLVGCGAGRRAARVLSGVLAALRERPAPPRVTPSSSPNGRYRSSIGETPVGDLTHAK
jgi:hypothetical protein